MPCSFLFTVKHRAWPKSSDYAGNDDYTALEINSQSLIDVLRCVLDRPGRAGGRS